MGRFTGKYAVVTGGSSGIGRAIVKQFVEEGILRHLRSNLLCGDRATHMLRIS